MKEAKTCPWTDYLQPGKAQPSGIPFGALKIIVILLLALTLVACNSQSGAPTAADIPPTPEKTGPAPQTEAQGPEKQPPPATPTAQVAGSSGKSISPLGPGPETPHRAAAGFPVAPDRDMFQLASELIPSAPKAIPAIVNPQPTSYAAGRKDTFWLIDLQDLEVYQRSFELKLVTPHAYWYVADSQSIRLADLQRSAAVFEETIYPRITSAFGHEWIPGVDNDPHLNVLNGVLKGAAGYYSSGDEYPRAVSRYSNQREIIYINVAAYDVNSIDYLEVLAHELQHAVHWRADPSDETWVNEGLSELATTVAGYPPSSVYRFLESRPTSVVHWPLSGLGVQASYGGASLFMHYLIQQYGDLANIKPLLAQPEDGIEGIEAYLATLGHSAKFRDVFANWMTANVLDQESGPYSYPGLKVKARHHRTISSYTKLESFVPQFAPEYTRINPPAGPFILTFAAPSATQLLPVDVGAQGCWWSNSGDSISTTLTRTLDLTGGQQITLDYQVWYELEEDWDYAYLQVSEDGGQTWTIIRTPNASPANPIGNGYGPGYTGSSSRWLDQSIDLTPYAGKEVHLRFQYITDDAVNGSGLCVRRLSLSIDSPDGAPPRTLSHAGWNPDGFAFVDNQVRQDYIVQVIWETDSGRVKTLELEVGENGGWIGELLVDELEAVDNLVVAVAALAPKTRVQAHYSLTVAPAP